MILNHFQCRRTCLGQCIRYNILFIGGKSVVSSVKVNGKDLADVSEAVLKKGTNATIEVKFTASKFKK